MIEQECVVVSSDVASNLAVHRTAGSYSLARPVQDIIR
jgi:hypothetical protein